MTEHMGNLLHGAEHTEGVPQTVAIADMMTVGTHLAEYMLLYLRFHHCTKVPCVQDASEMSQLQNMCEVFYKTPLPF